MFKKQIFTLFFVFINLFAFANVVQSVELPWYEPPTRLTVHMVSTITYDKGTNFFQYAYQITNDSHSVQDLWTFGFDLRLEESSMKSPAQWRTVVAIHDIFSGWSAIPAPDLKPSQHQDGFLIRSQSLPTIITSYAQGWPDRSKWPFHEDLTREEKNELVKRETFPNDYAQGKTVGPGLDPSSMSPTQIIDHLIAQKHAAFKLGWITNQGIVNSLDKKLDQVKNHLSKGQAKTAKNVLNAFTQELQAQRGKQVTENAYSLLHPTAMYLLNRLN